MRLGVSVPATEKTALLFMIVIIDIKSDLLNYYF